ncbi:hypothetical protein BIZ37_00395 [Photobacterium sp. BZF1]|uniref:hypothetical protein n=1 Tax=Photobacterium sp. BZF1 TaxID=1904457 RepID=UPI001653DDE0|nr:hypothetical protein [Photobacterium sp. BZF1]MBC7000997.1 hypothetical protein [Photobacterium sp. BZF1]
MNTLPDLSPSAEQIYLQIMTGAGPKLKATLKMAKKACDLIADSGNKMSYATIARLGQEHFGGPAYSTIANSNSKAKPYIDLRIKEYQAAYPVKTPNIKATLGTRTIDVSALDPSTRRMVMDLQQRNQLLEGIQKDLEKRVLQETRQAPHDTAQAITMGVDPVTGGLPVPERTGKQVTGSTPAVLPDSASQAYPREVIKVIRRLLEMVDPDDPDRQEATVRWSQHQGQPYLLGETEIEEAVLVTETELPVLAAWLEKADEHQ